MTVHMRVCMLLVAGGAILVAQSTTADPKLERGRYLAEEVGKCQDCHSPKGDNGQFDKERWMKGAVLDFAPLKPVEGWHKTAPDLTSESRLWQRWGVDGMVKFLMTGLNPRGAAADPPMPAYKLKKEDAEAMAAYLKSLP